MDKRYISEFEGFMDLYLAEHPQVVAEQHRNWCSFWTPEIDHSAPHPTAADIVPDDGYGFHMPHRHINSQGVTKH